MKHYWPQYLLIPCTLLVLLLQPLYALFVKPSSFRWRDGCFECVDNTPDSRRTTIWGRPGGQSWGCRWLWFNRTVSRDWGPLAVHERVHALHGEWINGIAHAALIPLAIYLDGGWHWVWCLALAQLAFGIAYGLHFLWEWGKRGFGPWKVEDENGKMVDGPGYEAYLRIFSERIAYRIDDEYERGLRPDAWGAR